MEDSIQETVLKAFPHGKYSPRVVSATSAFCVRLWLNPHRRLSVSYTWWYLCLCAGVAVSLLQESADAINEGAYDGDGERHVS